MSPRIPAEDPQAAVSLAARYKADDPMTIAVFAKSVMTFVEFYAADGATLAAYLEEIGIPSALFDPILDGVHAILAQQDWSEEVIESVGRSAVAGFLMGAIAAQSHGRAQEAINNMAHRSHRSHRPTGRRP
jgi:hypothetical protein